MSDVIVRPNEEKPVIKMDEVEQQIQENQVREEKPIEEDSESPIEYKNKETAGKDEVVRKEEKKEETRKFDISSLKELGIDVESEDELKSKWGKLSNFEEYESKLADYDMLNEKNEALINLLNEVQDPKKYFASDEEFKRNLIRQSFPDKNPSVIDKIISFEFRNSVESYIEAVALKEMLDNPLFDGGLDDAKEMVLSDIGIDKDTELSELTRAQKNLLSSRANKANLQFGEMKSVKVPESFNYEQRIQELKNQRIELETKREEAWQKPIEIMVNKFEKIPLNFKVDGNDVGVEFVVDNEFKSEYKERLKKMSKTVDYTKDNIQMLGQQMMNEYMAKNIGKIIQLSADRVIALKEEEIHSRLHEDSTLKDGIKLTPEKKGNKISIEDWESGMSRSSVITYKNR